MQPGSELRELLVAAVDGLIGPRNTLQAAHSAERRPVQGL
jgi:hypothetical protein